LIILLTAFITINEYIVREMFNKLVSDPHSYMLFIICCWLFGRFWLKTVSV